MSSRPAMPLTGLDAVALGFADEIDDIAVRRIVGRHIARRRAAERAVNALGLDGVNVQQFETINLEGPNYAA